MSDNRCVCCDEIIPEGRQVCLSCERASGMSHTGDYISKQVAIDSIVQNVVITTEEGLDLRNEIIELIKELPTLDEKDIIRKAFERVLQRLKDIKDDCFSEYYENLDGEYLHRGRLLGEVIEILRGECGINN
jgi:hypothetical protein